MSAPSKTSAATLWFCVGIAVFLPQIILIARNWGSFVEALPLLGTGLLGVLMVAGVVAVLAALVAAVSIWLKRARSVGA